MECDDVGVPDAAEDVDLGEEALAELAAQPLHGDLLHRHLRAPRPVPPQPHLRVRPRPDRPQQLVLPDPPPAAAAAPAAGAVPHRSRVKSETYRAVAGLAGTAPPRRRDAAAGRSNRVVAAKRRREKETGPGRVHPRRGRPPMVIPIRCSYKIPTSLARFSLLEFDMPIYVGHKSNI